MVRMITTQNLETLQSMVELMEVQYERMLQTYLYHWLSLMLKKAMVGSLTLDPNMKLSEITRNA